jgi:DNA-binding NarL/FixJ family response regulator
MQGNTINAMLVDDHAVVRMGFRLLLEGVSDIKVVAEAESGEEAVRRFAEVRPDVTVMDISLRRTRRRASWCCRPTRTRCMRGACSRRGLLVT